MFTNENDTSLQKQKTAKQYINNQQHNRL